MSTPRNLGAFADNVATNGKLEVAGINATGTPSSSTVLKGDGSWSTEVGPTGPAGADGAAGAAGPTGPQGTAGADGAAGPTGPQGTAGADGAAGAAGAAGPTGPAGADGATGPVAGSANQVVYKDSSNNAAGSANLVFDGSKLSVQNLNVTASSGDEGGEILLAKPVTNTSIAGTGVTIDVYQNKLRIFEQGGTTRGVYVDFTASASGVGTALGAGSVGPTGPAGTNGSTGPTGPAGTAGADGAAGAAGPTGPAGTAGTNGTDGAAGPTGPTGAIGPTGPAGEGGGGGGTVGFEQTFLLMGA